MQAETVQTINANLAECLKSVGNIGYTSVHNVCSGTVTVVPWGHVDWLGMGILCVFALALLTIAALFLKHEVFY
jgi:hypothetical protein